MNRLRMEELININTTNHIDKDFIQSLSKEDQLLLKDFRLGESCQDEVIEKIGEALEYYMIRLFGIEEAYHQMQSELQLLDPIQQFYQKVILPTIRKAKISQEMHYPKSVIEVIEGLGELSAIGKMQALDENAVKDWVRWVYQKKAEPYINWQIFAIPKKIEFDQLVKVKSIKPRVDYQWVGATLSTKAVMQHVHYCIDCHFKDNDSCSKGFWIKKDNAYKVNKLGRVLEGCPLNQKISQMHVMRKKHRLIAALAVIMIDNPLCLVTGDRICNDCMLSCIYQKVDPVDTPSVESHTVRQVLMLPYGAEIYLLLAKWNPLKSKDYQYTDLIKGSIAVVGMGPAGFAMTYYLLMLGVQVMGFDGLSIQESIDDIQKPIKDFYAWSDQMKSKVSGFGGVIDYGITARWDKRLILLIWVLLRRFPKFSLMGSTRMGGAIGIERLSQLGFDHVVMATGAGLPKAHPIQNKQGVYFANEFLMRLHLSGMMYHEVRMGFKLPIVVVGSGLTAIDAATEAQVYYISWVVQVAFWVDSVGLEKLLEGCVEREREVIKTWYRHGVYVRAHQGDPKALEAYIHQEGGVHIIYRKTMVESPAYRTNALELEKALEQGIVYHEHMNPIRVECEDDWVESIVCEKGESRVSFPAKTVLIATGSKPNVAYYYENRNCLEIKEGYYKRESEFIAKSEQFPNYVSIIGDLHPKYHGSVVGALASAKDSYQEVISLLPSGNTLEMDTVINGIAIHIKEVSEINEDIIELRLETETVLPIGTYIKITIMNDQVLEQIKGVVVKTNIVWVDREQEYAELLMCQTPIGVLGPSGTRILSQDCSNKVHVIVDKSSIIWAKATVEAALSQGKQAIVYAWDGGQVPGVEMLSMDVLQSIDEDAVYCLSASNLKKIERRGYRFRNCYAICDGPMMCMLKGICGQCIQWQIDDNNQPLKAVFSCSWQAQPIVLVDIEHLGVRQRVENIENTLYKKWKGLVRDNKHEKIR